MTAYLIANITAMTDPDKLKEYSGLNGPLAKTHGGRNIVGGAGEVLEGDVDSLRTVIYEFPDMDALKAWYNSDEYQPLKAMRQSAATGFLIAVDGG